MQTRNNNTVLNHIRRIIRAFSKRVLSRLRQVRQGIVETSHFLAMKIRILILFGGVGTESVHALRWNSLSFASPHVGYHLFRFGPSSVQSLYFGFDWSKR